MTKPIGSLQPGTTLGPYSVTAKIGEGGMGEVYRARDTKLDRDVALKVLPQAFTDDPDRLARFEREAKVLASLNHPNIGHIYGLEEAKGQKALVLELIEGPTLADRIKQGPIPVDEALPIAKQIAEALEAAHEQGIIHRDLKPANIKVKDDGAVKVLDFGLAKAFQPEPSDPNMSQSPTISLTAAATQMGMVIGTAAYMAPEQAKGKVVDKRADVWAFGAVVYEMLTGRRAFVGDDVSDTLAAVLRAEVNVGGLPEETPARLRQVLRACLERDPKQRVHDVADVRLAMEGAFDPPAPDSPAADSTGLIDRRVALVALAAAVLAALLAGSAVWFVRAPSNASPRPTNRFAIDLPASVQFRSNTTFPVALSRDGRRLVFNGSSSEGPQIYVRSLDEIAPVPVRGAGGSFGSLFLSPDGEWVAFNDTTDNTLKRVRISGGPPATICSTGLTGGGFRGATWGSRGSIVFATASGPGLMQVPEVGGDPAPLTSPEEGEVHGFPYFLPEGDALLFQLRRPAEADQIAVLDVESGEIRTLVEGAGPHFAQSGHLLFAREGAVWAAPFDLERRELSGDAVPVLEQVRISGFGASYPQLAVADDGTLVYATDRAQGAMSLVWVDRDGREEALPGIPRDVYFQVELSPEGGRLALTGTVNTDIQIYDIRRETLTPLTTDPADDSSPVWSADGDQIVFASNRGGQMEVFSRPSDGTGQAERLLAREDAGVLRPESWSPVDSTLLLTEVATNNANVIAWGIGQDAAAEVLIGTGAGESDAVVSPDGRWVAYTSNPSGRGEVYVQRYPELGDRRQISVSGGTLPRWSPDGSELFYASGDGRQLLAVAVDADTADPWGTPEVLFEGAYLPSITAARGYDVAPDGRFVMIKPSSAGDDGDGDQTPDLVVVQNWHEELKRLVPVD